jgi:hypothetical protein
MVSGGRGIALEADARVCRVVLPDCRQQQQSNWEGEFDQIWRIFAICKNITTKTCLHTHVGTYFKPSIFIKVLFLFIFHLNSVAFGWYFNYFGNFPQSVLVTLEHRFETQTLARNSAYSSVLFRGSPAGFSEYKSRTFSIFNWRKSLTDIDGCARLGGNQSSINPFCPLIERSFVNA